MNRRRFGSPGRWLIYKSRAGAGWVVSPPTARIAAELVNGDTRTPVIDRVIPIQPAGVYSTFREACAAYAYHADRKQP
jgi:hypothetical protein